MKLIKDKIHEVIGVLGNIAEKFVGLAERKPKQRYELKYDPTANTEGVWFTQKEFDDHIENFGGFVRKGKQMFTDYETLLHNVNVYHHKDAIHALCGSETNKALWRILMDALEQIKGTEVRVIDVRDHISLNGLISLVENENITIGSRQNIDGYLMLLPDYHVGFDARELPQSTYEAHGLIAAEVWLAIMEQIES